MLVKRYIIGGLLVWLPVWATFLVLKFLVDAMDQTLALLPDAYQPDLLIGFHVPGLGLLFSLLILFFTGLLVTNFIGDRLLVFSEGILARIPLVRSIYNGVKQVAETLFASD